MYWKYGGYRHDNGEVNLVSVNQRRMYSPTRGHKEFSKYTITIRGRLIADTTLSAQGQEDDLTSKVQALEDAYATDGLDFGLYHTDDDPTRHVYLNANALSQSRVVSLVWGPGEPCEYIIKKDYQITLEITYLELESAIHRWFETIRWIGTGGFENEWIHLFTPIGGGVALPYQFRNSNATTQKVIQQGFALGFDAYPIEAAPVYAAQYEHVNLRDISLTGPREVTGFGGTQIKMGTRWRYVFEKWPAFTVTQPTIR